MDQLFVSKANSNENGPIDTIRVIYDALLIYTLLYETKKIGVQSDFGKILVTKSWSVGTILILSMLYEIFVNFF